jgi:hypothetical protein
MSSKRKRLLAVGVLVAGVIAAGESALADSNTLPATTTIGFGSTVISGATVYSIVYTPNAQGTQIISTTIQLTGNFSSGYVIKAGFGTDTLTTCSVTGFDGVRTGVSCTGYTQSTSTATSYQVLVTNA